jgi:hypothetical protein
MVQGQGYLVFILLPRLNCASAPCSQREHKQCISPQLDKDELYFTSLKRGKILITLGSLLRAWQPSRPTRQQNKERLKAYALWQDINLPTIVCLWR